eukprot:8305974-Pyramimonas_sp.AAC.1
MLWVAETMRSAILDLVPEHWMLMSSNQARGMHVGDDVVRPSSTTCTTDRARLSECREPANSDRRAYGGTEYAPF